MSRSAGYSPGRRNGRQHCNPKYFRKNTRLPLRLRFGYSPSMNAKAIANQICDQADDFLGGVTKRDEAKAGIAEYLTLHHRSLAPADKKAVIDETMRILEAEGFFEAEANGDGLDPSDLSDLRGA